MENRRPKFKKTAAERMDRRVTRQVTRLSGNIKLLEQVKDLKMNDAVAKVLKHYPQIPPEMIVEIIGNEKNYDKPTFRKSTVRTPDSVKIRSSEEFEAVQEFLKERRSQGY